MFNITTKGVKLLKKFKGENFCTIKNELESPVVTLEKGKLRGALSKTINGSSYYSFKGIRYAEPPAGLLRFKAPTPVKPWQGVQDATKHSPICPQYDTYTSQVIEGSEDCLSLNVYTKTLSKSNLPVMVFIHGGAFMSGSANKSMYGPDFFLNNDVVLVTLNYRLEALGFLCLDTEEVPGNAGLKDQVLAMKWVKENIEQFGGDANNITLFGESAGGASVAYHMLSKMSSGLFDKAIIQSGICIQDWAIGSNPVERAFRAGNVLGTNTTDKTELLNYLRSIPAANLAKITLKTRTEEERYRGLALHFVPLIEKVDGPNSFITKDPTEVLLSKEVNKVPLIIGYNSCEGLPNAADQLKKAEVINKHPSFMIPKEIAHKVPKDTLLEFGERVKKYYLKGEDLSDKTYKEIANIQTDRQFSYNIQRFAHFYSNIAPTYLYKFDLDTELNVVKKIFLKGHNVEGACHADELNYMFSNKLNKYLYHKQEVLKKHIDRMTKMWTDFAKTGNPTPDPSSEVQWTPHTTLGREYLLIAEQNTMSSHADRERIEFWNQLYREAGLPSIKFS